ncbi:MAG TPA: transglutaminase domain-containing protein [Candidatus Caccousia avistercoris]|nr:transglutaminase domain-containing protein [Candidatus Caccousia avistercoris]
MKRMCAALLLCAALLFFSACSARQDSSPAGAGETLSSGSSVSQALPGPEESSQPQLPEESAEPEESSQPQLPAEPSGPEESSQPQPPVEPEDTAVSSLQELQERLAQAIAEVEQPPAFDVSAITGQEDLPMAVKNLYYAILNENPQAKYAYDLTAEIGADGLLHCSISYMPYRTGDFPDGFQGAQVDSMADLIQVAREGLKNQENIPIRITNPALQVDDMNRALQQVGESYLYCQLSRDATSIMVTPLGGMSMDEALARLEELDSLAEEIYRQTVTEGMGEAEQAQALYAYLTEHVRYDFRYYSTPGEMPYDSTTAYGALHDGLAICGGYAQAFRLLLQQAGVPCVTVSGEWAGENHMWALAKIEGRWLYFDPTADRGRGDYGFLYAGVEAAKMEGHTWDDAQAMGMAEALYP